MTTVRIALVLTLAVVAGRAAADVVVVANRSADKVRFTVHGDGRAEKQIELAAGGVHTLVTAGNLRLRHDKTESKLERDSVYYFADEQESIVLRRLDIGGNRHSRPLPKSDELQKPLVWRLKVYMDDEEPGVDAVWQARMKKRIGEASEVLERQCRIQLKIVGFGTWESDDGLSDFAAAARQFRRQVNAKDVDLVIGFSQQFPTEQTTPVRGFERALGRHLLIPDYSRRLSEPHRLSVLQRELGLYFGGTASPEKGSIMAVPDWERPPLGTRYDALNALVLALVSEEVRVRKIRELSAISPPLKRVISEVYGALGTQVGEQSTASADFQALLRRKPIEKATRRVLAELTIAADKNMKSGTPRKDDQLTEYLIRRAAEVAGELPATERRQAFLLAIGIGLDHSSLLIKQPLLRRFVNAVETPAERAQRLKVLGRPTILNRRDLCQHFVVSCYLTVATGSTAAGFAGVLKEILDHLSGSKFSPSDLAADRAGVMFAKRLLTRRLEMKRVASSFTVRAAMPTINDLNDFADLEKLSAEINRRLAQLKLYE